jgi:hypothetical protein
MYTAAEAGFIFFAVVTTGSTSEYLCDVTYERVGASDDRDDWQKDRRDDVRTIGWSFGLGSIDTFDGVPLEFSQDS